MSGVFRIIVTSSRGWKRDTATAEGHTIASVLDDVTRSAAAAGFDSVTVVHGGADGGDDVAEQWVRDRKRHGWSVDSEVHRPDYRRYGSRRAPWVRNQHMVNEGADLCCAFILNGSSGATGTADMAEAAAIHVQRFHVSTVAPMPDHDETDVLIAAAFAAPTLTTAEEAN